MNNPENQETPEIETTGPAPEVRYYSPETKGFYSSIIHGDQIPEDSIEVSDQEYISLLEGQSSGQEIFFDGTSPSLRDREPPKPTMEGIRKLRDTLLSASDWTQLPDSPLSESKKAEWAQYRQALRDLPETGDAEEIEFPEQPV